MKIKNNYNILVPAILKEYITLIKNRFMLFWVSLSYLVITVVIFFHRVVRLSTHYTMPDVDTDGGLWYQWYLFFIRKNDLVYDVTNLAGYPFGYDIAFSPISNLVYTLHVKVLELVGFSWSNLILVNNISSLLVYPIAATGAYLLTYYLTKNKSASYVSGIIYGFNFYAVFMGRGTMSINHIELIPYYFLSLLYFINKRNSFSLVLSSLVFAYLFKIDAYYAFWSGMFSVIFFLSNLKKLDATTLVKGFVKYYSFLFIVLALTNFGFIASQVGIMFNKELLVQTGRNSDPRGELTNILYYFSIPIPSINLLVSKLKFLAYFLYLPLYIAILGLFFNKNRKKLYSVLFLCFLFAVILSSYIPMLFWINKLYFQFFGMFRGVGRLAMFAFLFLSMLTGLSLSEFQKSSYVKKMPMWFWNVSLSIMILIILISNINVDSTWTKLTNMGKINEVYAPIRDNENISVIASYPLDLSSGDEGFPKTYQLMGQIIHEKSLATGVSQFGTDQQRLYQTQIKDISEETTIDTLTAHGVDTIVIYNQLLKNSIFVNEGLMKDSRLTFIGDYKSTYDSGYKSRNERSRDISVYQIKEVVDANRLNPEPIFSLSPSSAEEDVNFSKISDHKYFLELENLKQDSTLVFNFPYSEKFGLYLGNLSDYQVLTRQKDSAMRKASLFDEYKNGWALNFADIKTSSSDDIIVTNSDGSISVKLTLYFLPQRDYFIDTLLWYSTSFLCVGFLVFKGLKPYYYSPKSKF